MLFADVNYNHTFAVQLENEVCITCGELMLHAIKFVFEILKNTSGIFVKSLWIFGVKSLWEPWINLLSKETYCICFWSYLSLLYAQWSSVLLNFDQTSIRYHARPFSLLISGILLCEKCIWFNFHHSWLWNHYGVHIVSCLLIRLTSA